MYTQEYGDRTMGLWDSIVSGIKENIKNRKAASSKEYQNAFNQANQNIQQYTGNEGYQNTLEQAGKGAGVIANQAVGQGISGARSSGMSKAQAAAMGNQMANQTYANAFQGQQGVAQGLGQNAITAQQSQAGQAASEKQNVFNRATMNSPETQLANVAETVAKAI